MGITRVLIAVKTYPTISSKYDELVCTAGFLEDGSWIRIYPISFRKKDYEQQYSKYDWIELDLVKNKSDFRPESYRPYSADTSIAIVDKINTDNNWQIRKETVLKNVNHLQLINLGKLLILLQNQRVGNGIRRKLPNLKQRESKEIFLSIQKTPLML